MDKLLETMNLCAGLHQSLPINDRYKKVPLHIALEKADLYKDWDTFKLLFKLAPDFLQGHLEITGEVFNYNYTKLPFKKRNELFK
jgi:hypothetical protein